MKKYAISIFMSLLLTCMVVPLVFLAVANASSNKLSEVLESDDYLTVVQSEDVFPCKSEVERISDSLSDTEGFLFGYVYNMNKKVEEIKTLVTSNYCKPIKII